MDINQIYQIVQFAVNKSQNGYVSPSQFNLLVNQAQIDYQDFLLGNFQQYQYGKAASRISDSKNSDVRQRLIPFIEKIPITIDGSGNSAYPSDYVQTDALRTNNFERIRYVKDDDLYSYYNSKIDPIATNPIYLLEKNGFRFYPVNLGSANLSYVKKPPTIVWDYTLDVNGRPVYSSTTSEQPLWADVDKLEIITRILKLVGVNLQDGVVQQYANQIIQTGQ
jgi:hypothetical protein